MEPEKTPEAAEAFKAAESTPPQPTPASTNQVMDVIAQQPDRTPPPAPQSTPAASDAPAQQKHPEKPQEPPKPQKMSQPKSGSTAAIVATVIIVLGLAALATYAYLKTVK